MCLVDLLPLHKRPVTLRPQLQDPSTHQLLPQTNNAKSESNAPSAGDKMKKIVSALTQMRVTQIVALTISQWSKFAIDSLRWNVCQRRAAEREALFRRVTRRFFD